MLNKGKIDEEWEVRHKKSGLTRSIKIINKSKLQEAQLKNLKNEVKILAILDHPNIQRVFEFYEDSHFFYIITELCCGGTLEMLLKSSSQKCFNEMHVANLMK